MIFWAVNRELLYLPHFNCSIPFNNDQSPPGRHHHESFLSLFTVHFHLLLPPNCKFMNVATVRIKVEHSGACTSVDRSRWTAWHSENIAVKRRRYLEETLSAAVSIPSILSISLFTNKTSRLAKLRSERQRIWHLNCISTREFQLTEGMGYYHNCSENLYTLIACSFTVPFKMARTAQNPNFIKGWSSRANQLLQNFTRSKHELHRTTYST